MKRKKVGLTYLFESYDVVLTFKSKKYCKSQVLKVLNAFPHFYLTISFNYIRSVYISCVHIMIVQFAIERKGKKLSSISY